MPRRKPPEIAFQDHIAAFLIREHGYGVLEQGEITDTDHAIAEDHLWAFLNDTQPFVRHDRVYQLVHGNERESIKELWTSDQAGVVQAVKFVS